MRLSKPEQVQIGDWVTLCCERDLYQITTPDELAEIREQVNVEELHYECWPDRHSAVSELLARQH